MPLEVSCELCGGTGQYEGLICPLCGGDGKVTSVHDVIVSHTLASKSGIENLTSATYSDKLFATYKIIEATDSTEYNALTATQKSVYGLIVSCGVVDLTEGTSIRTKLWNMFGEGTTTRENLEALLV